MAVWFFLPAGVANMMPILVAKVPGLARWNAPIDGGKMFRGKRVLGSHKTWRGLVSGVVAATVVLWIQQILIMHIDWFATWTSQVDYLRLPLFVVGPLFGLGALGGDAIESFLKRQRGVAPGHGWFPWDQTDYIIGGAALTAPFVQLRFEQYAVLLVIWLMMHLVASYIGYLLGLKERPI